MPSKRAKPKQNATPKKGVLYEQAVAELFKVFQPNTKVSQGLWIVGPDGRRELDVFIEGNISDQAVKCIVECKDFNPKTTGPVGIGYIDALDSKRRDLQMDFAMLFSNAGFTSEAIRKAKRVGIGLGGAMRTGDQRLRFAVVDEIYQRCITINSMSLTLHGHREIPEGRSALDFFWNGIPVGNWVINRILLLVAANPIVNGTVSISHDLVAPLLISWDSGSSIVTKLGFTFSISGTWLANRVTIDSTSGIYDWLRRRVRLAGEATQVTYNGINHKEGVPVLRPPEQVFLRERFMQGDFDMRLFVIENFSYPEPIPQIDHHFRPEQLKVVLDNLPPEFSTSSVSPLR